MSQSFNSLFAFVGLFSTQLLEAQFATARYINSLAVMQKCYSESVTLGVPVNEPMAREALSVFLFWGEHASAQAVLEALGETLGPRRAADLAAELLLVCITHLC